MIPATIQPVELLVLQPTSFCNLDCTYCYLAERAKKKRMGIDTVDRVGARILAQRWTSSHVTVVWHAGEPLVVPPAWYEEAFGVLEGHRPADVRLTHAFQTNATLLSKEWLPLLSRPDVRVGISIDGPSALHDRCRRTRDGRGTFERTMRGVRLLSSAKVPFHVITVLSLESLSRADELLDFYLAEGIDRICFNIEEIEGVNIASSLAVSEVETAFRRFLERIVERLDQLPRPLWIREIANALATLRTPSCERPRNPQAEPLAILSVDAEGRLSTYSPELLDADAPNFSNFRFGNIRDGGPELLLTHDAFLRARADIDEGVRACRSTCPWFRWCAGGAPANKYFETGSLKTTETLFCRLTKQVLLDTVLCAIEDGQLPALLRGCLGAPPQRAHPLTRRLSYRVARTST